MERSLMRLDAGQIEVVDDNMAEILRQKTPAERIRIGFMLWSSARKMLRSHLKHAHPQWDEERIDKELRKRFYYEAV